MAQLVQRTKVSIAGQPYEGKDLTVGEVGAADEGQGELDLWMGDYYDVAVAQSTNIREEGLQREVRGVYLDPDNMQYALDWTRAQIKKETAPYTGRSRAPMDGYMIDGLRAMDFGQAANRNNTWSLDLTAGTIGNMYAWMHATMPTYALYSAGVGFSLYQYSALILFGEYILPGQSRLFDAVVFAKSEGSYYPPWAVPEGTGLVYRYPSPILVLGSTSFLIGKKPTRLGYDTSIPIGLKCVKSDKCLAQMKAVTGTEKGILQYS